MNKAKALLFSAIFTLAACGANTSTSPYYAVEEATVVELDPLAQAAEDLKAAKAVKSEWRFIDKSGGGSAQNMSDFMKIAEEKAAAGETEEANRIAALISKYAKLGIAQAEKQKAAKPYYPQ